MKSEVSDSSLGRADITPDEAQTPKPVLVVQQSPSSTETPPINIKILSQQASPRQGNQINFEQLYKRSLKQIKELKKELDGLKASQASEIQMIIKKHDKQIKERNETIQTL